MSWTDFGSRDIAKTRTKFRCPGCGDTVEPGSKAYICKGVGEDGFVATDSGVSKMKKQQFSFIEFMVVGVIGVIAMVAIWLACTSNLKDYRYDGITGTSTWTDDDGRRFMKSPDGSVREMSRSEK